MMRRGFCLRRTATGALPAVEDVVPLQWPLCGILRCAWPPPPLCRPLTAPFEAGKELGLPRLSLAIKGRGLSTLAAAASPLQESLNLTVGQEPKMSNWSTMAYAQKEKAALKASSISAG